MTISIVKFISLLALAGTSASTSYVDMGTAFPFDWDADAYDGSLSIYFEVTLKTNNASGVAYANISDSAGNAVTDGEVSTASNSYVRLRTAALTLVDATRYTVRIKSNNASYTTSVLAAQLVIVQSGSVTKTRTVVQFTKLCSTTSASYADVGNNSALFHWDAERWGGTVAAYLEGYIFHAGSGQTCYAQLFDGTNELGEISRTATTLELVRTAALTLIDNATYRLRMKSASGSTARCYGARMIIDQTSGVSPTMSFYEMNAAHGSTTDTSGLALNCFAYHDNDQWAGGITSVFLSGYIYAGGAATATLEARDGASVKATIATTNTTAFVWAEGSPFTPDDNKEFAHYIKTNNGGVSAVYRLFYLTYLFTAPNEFSLAATLTAASATDASALAVLRDTSATLTAGTSTMAAELVAARALAASLEGDSATGGIALAVARLLVATLTADTSTTAAELAAARALAASLEGDSATGGIALAVGRLLAAELTAASSTEDVLVTLTGLWQLTATLTAASATAASVLAVVRDTSATLTAGTSTTSAELAAARALAASLQGDSATGDIALAAARLLAAELTAASSTEDVLVTLTGLWQLAATLTAASATDASALAVVRDTSATLTAGTSADAVTVALARALAASLEVDSATGGIALVVARALAASLQGDSATGDIALAVARLLAAELTAGTSTTAAELAVARLLTASLQGDSATGDIALAAARALAASLEGDSATGGIALAVARLLAAELAPQSAISTIDLAVGRALLAVLSAASLTGESDLAVVRSMTAMATSSTLTPGVSLPILRTMLATAQATSGTSAAMLRMIILIEVLFRGMFRGMYRGKTR